MCGRDEEVPSLLAPWLRELREGATVCVAWDGEARSMLASVDGGPFLSPCPPDSPDAVVCPDAVVGAGLFPAMSGEFGCAVEYSMRGELGLTPPSPDYLPFDQAPPFSPFPTYHAKL